MRMAQIWNIDEANAGKDVEEQGLGFTAHRWECKVGTVTLEVSLAVSYKTKHTFTIQSRNHTLWYLPKLVQIFVYTRT